MNDELIAAFLREADESETEMQADEGFECCRNQGTAFCDHGPGRQEDGW